MFTFTRHEKDDNNIMSITMQNMWTIVHNKYSTIGNIASVNTPFIIICNVLVVLR